MSAASDPDRLERLAKYARDDPPNTTLTELATALDDAAARIRRQQSQMTEAMALLRWADPT